METVSASWKGNYYGRFLHMFHWKMMGGRVVYILRFFFYLFIVYRKFMEFPFPQKKQVESSTVSPPVWWDRWCVNMISEDRFLSHKDAYETRKQGNHKSKNSWIKKHLLVAGWTNPSEKYDRQTELFPQF